MIPFSLDGQQFLLFYGSFVALVVVAYAAYVNLGPLSARASAPRIDTLANDPYAVACLRGGPDEAVRLAILNLIDRDLLTAAKGNGLRATLKAQPEALRRSLDKAIVAECSSAPLSATGLMENPRVRAAAVVVERDLQRQGLLLTAEDHAARQRARSIAMLLIAGLALVRIVQALSNGRFNLVFLIILAALALALVWVMPTRNSTPAGRQAMAHLQALLKRLKDRAQRLSPGGATHEAMLFAAVFGIYALPAAAFPFVDENFPRERPRSDSGGGSSSDSGGSSSSSDGGSSGCGGGGSSGCGGCGGGGGD
jgi:uncharacterized protein (TIGR04222 family)